MGVLLRVVIAYIGRFCPRSVKVLQNHHLSQASPLCKPFVLDPPFWWWVAFEARPSQILRITRARGGSVVDVLVNLQRAHLRERQQTDTETGTSCLGGGGGGRRSSTLKLYKAWSREGGEGGEGGSFALFFFNLDSNSVLILASSTGSNLHSPAPCCSRVPHQYRRARGKGVQPTHTGTIGQSRLPKRQKNDPHNRQ